MTPIPRRIAFVTPRYGEHILGGAESLIQNTAVRIAQRGHHVEIFSTSAKSPRTWESERDVIHAEINGIPAHLFPIRYTDRAHFRDLHQRLHAGDALTPDEQLDWIHCGPHSASLYAALHEQRNNFDLFVCAPYSFPLIHYAAAAVLPRAAIWPCLHDELYADLLPTRLLLRDCFCIFYNTEEENNLAQSRIGIRHPHARVVGSGVDDIPGDAQRFRSTHGIRDPFLLYAGRIEAGKNVPLLLEFFAQYKATRHSDLKLVLIGEGRSGAASADVIQLGYLSEQDKRDAMAAATALCQPSVHESLSYVVLESWLAGVPVLVHSRCAVTRMHVVHSGGGLHFEDAEVFGAAVDALRTNPALHSRMGADGRTYARTRYGWPDVLDRFEQCMNDWL